VSEGRTVVVNLHRRGGGTPAFDVYIGRACPRAADPRCRVSSEWCNCFRVGRDTKTAGGSLRRYERMLRAYLANNPDAVPRLLALRGKRLGCWCTPEPCHGDVLVRVIEELGEREGTEARRHEGTEGPRHEGMVGDG
jgi:hypothetical protein